MRVLGVIIAALCLGSCGSSEPQVPEAVKQAMSAEFPDDGQIHVLKAQGKFLTKKNSTFCHAPGRVDRSLVEAAPRLDLNPGIDGVENAPLNRDVGGNVCKDDGSNLVSDWLLVRNRQGGPYKLVLAVWQGDVAKGGAYWVGGIERTEGFRPELSKLAPPMMGPVSRAVSESERFKYLTLVSVNQDAIEINTAFISQLPRHGEEK